MQALQVHEARGDVSAHDLRTKLSEAELLLEQELEMMSTDELKRLIEEGEFEGTGGLNHEEDTTDSQADQRPGQCEEEPRTPIPREGEAEPVSSRTKKSDREEARDIIRFVQTQGFEGIAEEEWDSDELDELEELKREIDRIQEELKFQRELREFERRLRTMSTYELKVLMSRIEGRETDRFTRRRMIKERSATVSNDGSYAPSIPESDRENRFFDEMCETLRAMLQQAIAERHSQKEICGDEEDEIEDEQEVSDSDEGDSSEGSGRKGKIKRVKKKDGEEKQRKRKGKRLNSLIGSLISSKSRARKESKTELDPSETANEDEAEAESESGSWLKRKGSKTKKRPKESKKDKKKLKRKDSKGIDAGILTSMLQLPAFALGSRSKLPSDLDSLGIIARPTIFDESILEGWLYRRKEKGMRKTWIKRWGVIMKGRFLLYDDKQKEKLEEWDLMFVKAQPGVAKVKRKDSRSRERPSSDAEEHNESIGRQRSASIASSLSSAQSSSPRPPPRNDSIVGLVSSVPSPSSACGLSQDSTPISGSTLADSPFIPRQSSPAKSSSSSALHFFELLTRQETIRFLSPTERENEEWVEVINRERDTLVTCMLLAGDDDEEKKEREAGNESGNDEGTETSDGKLSIAESRRLLREIIEADLDDHANSRHEVPDEQRADKGKEAEQGSESPSEGELSSLASKRKNISERSIRWFSNMYCADCGEHCPEWASINCGTFICLACSGIHRSLGVHISQVRSTVLDRWRMEDVELIRSVGNRKFNEQWKQRVERILESPYGEPFKECFSEAAEYGYCHLRSDAPLELRRKFLRIKYAGDLASVLGLPRPCTIIVSNKKDEQP